MAQQSARRGRKNQGFPLCREHAVGDVVPVRELPYGPAASDAASEAGQMAASDYVHYLQKTACVFWGVHRWRAKKEGAESALFCLVLLARSEPLLALV